MVQQSPGSDTFADVFLDFNALKFVILLKIKLVFMNLFSVKFSQYLFFFKY